ncbi:enoyl-CoA hydratase/isomerase family protein [Paramixta manurensis]|uniref:Enoyl-CoA hydratase/isomerase family protein n=1 Tax=Paramixta manurensis TaxID=2740817 RepID=A0A6M8UEL0_9GAMM|nr:enoyl-CoA hydratase/isomerase family protein [Erwiniaceae bacterium PD-1]
MSLITYETNGAVAVVTLNNPPLNLVTLALSKQLRETLQSLDADEAVRVIVLTGSGQKAFCVGSDIKEFPEVWDNVIEKKLQKENETFNTIEFLSKPVIAAMEGVVCGGGFEMAMACDLRVLSANGKIALPEINLGVFPGSGGLFRLPKLIGAARAVELMMTGEFVEAQQCLAWGMVNRLAPAGSVLDVAVSLAQQIALKPHEAIKLIKQGVREIGMQPTDQCFLKNLRFSENIFRTADCAEGVAAFLEKREAKFL